MAVHGLRTGKRQAAPGKGAVLEVVQWGGLLLYSTQRGGIHAWDLRSDSLAWTLPCTPNKVRPVGDLFRVWPIKCHPIWIQQKALSPYHPALSLTCHMWLPLPGVVTPQYVLTTPVRCREIGCVLL